MCSSYRTEPSKETQEPIAQLRKQHIANTVEALQAPSPLLSLRASYLLS